MPCPRENLWCWTASQKIPADVLKGAPRMVFSILCVHADVHGHSAYSVAHLACVTGQSRRTVFRALTELEELRLLRRVHRHNKRNLYQVSAALLDFYFDCSAQCHTDTSLGANGNSGDTVTPPRATGTPRGDTVTPDSHSSHIPHKEGAAPLKRSSAPQDEDPDQDPTSAPVTPEQRRATLEMLKHLRSKPI